jgi:hypothetical protein
MVHVGTQPPGGFIPYAPAGACNEDVQWLGIFDGKDRAFKKSFPCLDMAQKLYD